MTQLIYEIKRKWGDFYVAGFGCFKTYFESVNKNDHRLKKDNTGQQVSEAEEEISAYLMIIER